MLLSQYNNINLVLQNWGLRSYNIWNLIHAFFVITAFMDKDNDDLATDFNQTTEQQSQSKQKNQKDNEQNESKFGKQLNMQIVQPEQGKYEEETVFKDRMKPQHHEQQRVINDKNILITPTQQAFHQENEVKEQDQKRQPLRQNEGSEHAIQKSDKSNSQTNVISEELQKLELREQSCLQQDQLYVENKIHNQPKEYKTEPQTITKFSHSFKSRTITLNEARDEAQQSKYYFENYKIILTEPITSINSSTTFRLDNLKYCIGVGVALQEVLQKHQYDYKSTTNTQMGHGLYIVTTQGYSWSHSQNQDDDAFREHFNTLYSGVNINLKLQGENLSFKAKKSSFSMLLPSHIRQKYTLCFCTYLHEKTDAVSIIPQ